MKVKFENEKLTWKRVTLEAREVASATGIIVNEMYVHVFQITGVVEKFHRIDTQNGKCQKY